MEMTEDMIELWGEIDSLRMVIRKIGNAAETVELRAAVAKVAAKVADRVS